MICQHGNRRTCPEDQVCQVRLKGGTDAAEWETHTVLACDASPAAWRSQVAPVLRRRGYETRVVSLGTLLS